MYLQSVLGEDKEYERRIAGMEEEEEGERKVRSVRMTTKGERKNERKKGAGRSELRRRVLKLSFVNKVCERKLFTFSSLGVAFYNFRTSRGGKFNNWLRTCF